MLAYYVKSSFLHLSDAEAADHGNEGTMIMLTYDVKSSFLHLSDAAAEDQGNEEPRVLLVNHCLQAG
jgi:hypothetical protein